jgi:type IV pilus assembly protein PilX
VFLLVMTLIGVTAMQGTSQQESMARNARDRNLAFQAAEAALRYGEDRLTPLRQPVIPDTDLGTFWTNYDWTTQSQGYGGTLGEVFAPPRYVIEELPPVSRPPRPGESFRAGQPLPQDDFFRVTARGQGGTADAVVILQTTYKR